MPPKNTVNPELDEIIARPENKLCADCGAKAPRWASVNLGVLFCIDCSGAHRNLGVHISVVKSVTLDKWQPKWISTVSKIGNQVANNYYEYKLPKDYQRPREGDSRETIKNWIRNKYDRRDYAPRNKPSPSELLAQGRDPDVYGQRDGDGERNRSHQDNGQTSASGDRPRRSGEQPQRRDGSQDDRTRRQAATAEHSMKPTDSAVAVTPVAVAAPLTGCIDLLSGFQDTPPTTMSTSSGDNWAQFSPQHQAPQTSQSADFTAKQEQQLSHQFGDLQLNGCGSGLSFPDVFTPVQQPQRAEQLQDQKVDYMKNCLAVLYQQPSDNPYAAFNTAGMSMGMAPQQACCGAGQGYGSHPSNFNVPAAGQLQNAAVAFMHLGAHQDVRQTSGVQSAMPGGWTAEWDVGAGSLASAVGQATSAGLSPPMRDPGKAGETSHAEAMRQVLDSLCFSGTSSGSGGKRLQQANVASREVHESRLAASCDSLDIDAFSAFDKRVMGRQQLNGPAATKGMQHAPGAVGTQQMSALQQQATGTQQLGSASQVASIHMEGMQPLGGMQQVAGMQAAAGWQPQTRMQPMTGMYPMAGMAQMAGTLHTAGMDQMVGMPRAQESVSGYNNAGNTSLTSYGPTGIKVGVS